jgi:hypothetical protein
MYITITVKNAQMVSKGLANIKAEIPRIAEKTIKKIADGIVREMRNYPPERAGQKYVRTYRFRDSWNVKKLVSGYTVTTSSKYANYVVGTPAGAIGNGGQAWMHVGRWLLFRDVAEQKLSGALPGTVEEYIKLKIKQEKLD